jgi:chromosomal replication initiation ATPase DnaA
VNKKRIPDMIIEFASKTGVPVGEILGRNRLRRIAEVRMLYWYVLSLNGFGVTEIARLCEKNHATIIHGIHKIKGLLDLKDRKITELYNLTKNIKR